MGSSCQIGIANHTAPKPQNFSLNQPQADSVYKSCVVPFWLTKTHISPWVWRCFNDFFKKRWLNKIVNCLINDYAVCRTASAILALSNIAKIDPKKRNPFKNIYIFFCKVDKVPKDRANVHPNNIRFSNDMHIGQNWQIWTKHNLLALWIPCHHP